MLWTDTTLKPRILVIRLGHVDVHVDLTLLLEQDVVDWANDLKKMYKFLTQLRTYFKSPIEISQCKKNVSSSHFFLILVLVIRVSDTKYI